MELDRMSEPCAAFAAPQSDAQVDEDATLRLVERRLIPFLVVCFLTAYLDRVNLSFAALSMNKDLGFSPTVYGWGAGVFFLGYALFEAPSNYVLHRVGARLWIARIMVSWGLVSASMGAIWNETSFVGLRFLLGVAEAGFAPGAILYLTYWIPASQRAKALGAFLFAVPLSTIIGAPLSGAMMTSMDGVAGLEGWRWLFILEALPSIALGVAAYFVLTDRPSDARWLTKQQRDWLTARIARDASGAPEDHGVEAALRDPRILRLGCVYFGIVLSLYGLGMWLPQIEANFGLSPFQAGIATAIPFLCGAVAMLLWGRRSDRCGERIFHTAAPALVAAVGLVIAALHPDPLYSTLALCIAAAGTLGAMPPFWALTTECAAGARAAITIALVNSVGNLAGFVGPYLVGWIKEATGTYSWGLIALALGPVLSAALTFWRFARRVDARVAD
jgi:ACS family tartrate transporter-like MFS transporter